MTICGQTLILVDNDSTVTELNQKIIKSTLKYMLYHAPANRAFSINNYGHELEEEESFSQDINDLLCKVDLMEFKKKDSNLTDVLTKVLKDWKKSDFACRDIVVFTDGIEGEATEFVDEELFYMIKNTCYPIYVVDLVQDNNAQAKKHLSAIATTSEGELLMSEYPGDDAGVDRHLSEEIFNKMDEYAAREWKQYEDPEEETEALEETNGVETGGADEETGEEDSTGQESTYENSEQEKLVDNEEYLAGLGQMDGQVIYETESTIPVYERPVFLIFSVIFMIMAIIGVFISSFMIMKKRKKDKKEEKRVTDIVKRESRANAEADKDYENDSGKNMTKDIYAGFGDYDPFDGGFSGDYDDGLLMPGDDEDDSATRLLSDDEGLTRLLTEEKNNMLELIDMDSNESMVLPIKDSVVLGRSKGLSDCLIEDDSVSKRHLKISCDEGNFYIEDLNSSNGSYLNDVKINKKTAIKNEDIIKIGCRCLRVKI